MRLRTRTAAVAAVAAVGLTAATGLAFASGASGGDDLPSRLTADEASLPEDDAAERAALVERASVDEAAARATAVEAVGGGEVASSELEDEDRSVVWEVAVRAADGSLYEVTVDGNGAGVLSSERDEDADDLSRPGTIRVDESKLPEDPTAKQAALAELATVAEEAARTAAVAAVGGGQVALSELEDEDGSVVWEVSVRVGDGSLREVTIDAGNAGVLDAGDRDAEDQEDED